MSRKSFIIAVLATAACAGTANAQYYQIANSIPSLIRPALSGGLNYKGFVEAEYLHGLGSYNCDFVGISTTQGFRYSNWFFMGAGLGVQYVHTTPAENWSQNWPAGYVAHGTSTNGVMIPLFTDFRFNIGGATGAAFFADIRVGASFLVGNNYLRIHNGYINGNEYFYLRPSIGVRIPVSEKHPKQAIDIGVSYQLLTNNYWDSWNRNVAISALGGNISFEW